MKVSYFEFTQAGVKRVVNLNGEVAHGISLKGTGTVNIYPCISSGEKVAEPTVITVSGDYAASFVAPFANFLIEVVSMSGPKLEFRMESS